MWFGPPLSKFGKWMKRRGISQVEMSELSGVPRGTIGNLARDETKRPTRLTLRKLWRAIKEIDPNVDPWDFWDM